MEGPVVLSEKVRLDPYRACPVDGDMCRPSSGPPSEAPISPRTEPNNKRRGRWGWGFLEVFCAKNLRTEAHDRIPAHDAPRNLGVAAEAWSREQKHEPACSGIHSASGIHITQDDCLLIVVSIRTAPLSTSGRPLDVDRWRAWHSWWPRTHLHQGLFMQMYIVV